MIGWTVWSSCHGRVDCLEQLCCSWENCVLYCANHSEKNVFWIVETITRELCFAMCKPSWENCFFILCKSSSENCVLYCANLHKWNVFFIEQIIIRELCFLLSKSSSENCVFYCASHHKKSVFCTREKERGWKKLSLPLILVPMTALLTLPLPFLYFGVSGYFL